MQRQFILFIYCLSNIYELPAQTFATATSAFYNSTEFKQVANTSAEFLASLRPIVGAERPLKLTNMVRAHEHIFSYSRLT